MPQWAAACVVPHARTGSFVLPATERARRGKRRNDGGGRAGAASNAAGSLRGSPRFDVAVRRGLCLRYRPLRSEQVLPRGAVGPVRGRTLNPSSGGCPYAVCQAAAGVLAW